MPTSSASLRRGIRDVLGVAWAVVVAATVVAATGFTVAQAATVDPVAADGESFRPDWDGYSQAAAPEIEADDFYGRDSGLRRTESDVPAVPRGKVDGVVGWIDDSHKGPDHGLRPLSRVAGALAAPSVDLSRLCRLTC